MQRTLSILGLAATLFATHASFAADCHVPGQPGQSKWITPLSLDEIYKTHPPGDISDVPTWPFAKQRLFYSRFFKDSPQSACDLWARKVSPQSTVWTTANRALNEAVPIHDPNDPNAPVDSYECNFDCNRNGVLDANDPSACGVFPGRFANRLVAQTDPVCDRASDVHGPYDDGTTGGYARGAEFTTAQKSSFKAANAARDSQGRLTSDAYPLIVNGVHADVHFLDATAGSSSSIQIDHLVPRKDVYGCGCGTNSPRNAGLVSAGLNNKMSNDPSNPVRQALLGKFAPPPPTPAPALDEGPAPTLTDLAQDAADEAEYDDPSIP